MLPDPLPATEPETGPSVLQERYDEADLKQLFAWRPDVDALVEAILALPQPEAARLRPSVGEDWAAFRDIAQDLRRRRTYE